MRFTPVFLRPLLCSALASAMALCATAPARAQLAASPWPKFQHDAQNTGQSDFNGPASEPGVLWLHLSRSLRRAAPSIGSDGTVYVADARRPYSALDPDTGEVVWSTSEGHKSTSDRSSPVVKSDGTIYFGARDNDLWSVAPNGTTNWRFSVRTDGDVSTSPTIGPDGTIYMASDSLGAGRTYGINPDGTEKWLNPLGIAPKNGGPALSHDASIVYFAAGGRQIVALDTTDGSEIWRTSVSENAVGSRAPNFTPVVGPDGTVYFATRPGIFALDGATGSILWTFSPFGQSFLSGLALSDDGTIYVGATGSPDTFFAVDSFDGSVKWTFPMPKGPGLFRNNQAAIGADGTVYVGYHKNVFAFSGEGDGNGHGEVLWSKPLPVGPVFAGVVIAGPGKLYVPAGRGLYALEE